MQVEITEREQEILHMVRNYGARSSIEISDVIGQTKKAIHHVMMRMASDVFGNILRITERRGRNGGGRLTPMFDLSPRFKYMTDDEFHSAIQFRSAPDPEEKRTKFEPVLTGTNKGLRKSEVMKSKEKIEFIKLNLPIFELSRVSHQVGSSPDIVRDIARELGIFCAPEDKHPSYEIISSKMDCIPAGTKVSEWLGGTAFHIPNNQPGINRVTRHFTGA